MNLGKYNFLKLFFIYLKYYYKFYLIYFISDLYIIGYYIFYDDYTDFLLYVLMRAIECKKHEITFC